MSKTVYVVGGDRLVEAMFIEQGWAIQSVLGMAQTIPPDLICFTGGEDVSPELYGHQNTGQSYTNPKRDEAEHLIYTMFVDHVPMVGICRGGQFLNVMNGGKMIQHIDGHHMGYHRLHGFLEGAGSYIMAQAVHGDHHQGMVAPSRKYVEAISDDDNQEIIWYPETKCLCFQPHPEWGHEPTKKLFFKMLEEYLP